jgi:hypothetical protein
MPVSMMEALKVTRSTMAAIGLASVKTVPHSLSRYVGGEALDGQAVDWPHWPLDRWTRQYERYTQE